MMFTTTNKEKSILRFFKKDPSKECLNSFKARDEERLYVEFLLKKLWFNNKGKDNIFSFKPVNIRMEKNPYYVDAIKFDSSAKTTESLNIFFSTATDDHLLFRETNKDSFIDAPCFRTAELYSLLCRLQKYVY